ncbi:iron-containing alcohol dehydrogenase, partial [Paenibacillus sepulcri]|nr:iron-containing alcohol dehydrogenase [Paenibacillus sepulcri]
MIGSLLVPQQVKYGPGVFDSVAETVGSYGNHALLVTDPAMVGLGIADRCMGMLRSAGLSAALYADIHTEPTLIHVEQGLDILRREGCNVILAVGGGSCLDTAKAIAVMAGNPGSLRDYWNGDRFKSPPLPLVAVPTTAGTGSEVTQITVIIDPDN